MAVNLVTQAILAAQLEELIDRKAKISKVANTKYEEMFTGKATTQVVIRRFPNVEHTHGVSTAAGSTIAETDLTVQSETYDLTELDQLNIKVKDVNKVINDFSQEDNIIDRAALRTALNHDSFVAALAVQNAGTTVNDQAPVTYTKDTIEAAFAALQNALRLGDVEENNQALFMNSGVLSLSNQAPMHTGFDKSLRWKETAEVWNAQMVSGFMGSWSNNLPVKYTLTIGAAVTEDDFIKFQVPNAKKLAEGTSPAYDEVVFTAKDAPSAAGEFDVAGSAGAQQTIINAMINGTGTPGSTNYIALSAADRGIMQRGFINCQTFGATTATKAGITARAGTTMTISMTSGSNVVAARTNLLIAADPKAIHFGQTMQNFKIVGTETNNQAFASNVMWENVYGGKVTLENKARIAVLELTN